MTKVAVYNEYGEIVGMQRMSAHASDEWKYLKMFIVMLIYTGLLALATYVAYKLALYVACGDDCSGTKPVYKSSTSKNNGEKYIQSENNITQTEKQIAEKEFPDYRNANGEVTIVEEVTETEDKVIITETRTKIINK